MEWWAAIIILPLAVVLTALFAAVLPWSALITVSSSGEAGLCLKLLKRVPVLFVRTILAGHTEVCLAGLSFRIGNKKPTKGDGKKHGDTPEQNTGPALSLPRRLRAAAVALTPDTIIVLMQYFRGMIGDTDSQLEISGEIGLGDPAATGIVCGMAYGLWGARGVTRVDIRPNFFEPVLAGELKLAVTAIPMMILLRTVKTALHPDIRRVWIAFAAPQRGINARGFSIKGGV